MESDQSVFPCLRGVMGDWVYYSTLMNAEQVAKHIATAKSIREAKSLDDYLQRDLTKNVKKICNYLLDNESRLFNSMIIGVFDAIPDWLAFDVTKSDKLKKISNITKKSISESVGLLMFDGSEKMFAIDGQHRAEAIRCSFEKNKDVMKNDQFSVILVAHNDDEKGKKRSRKLFADINKKAVKVSKGDLVIIDEEEPSSMVARMIYGKSPYFNCGKLIALTNTANLDSKDNKHFSTLITLDQIVNILKPLHSSPRKKRWNDNDIDELTKIAEDFFNFVIANIKEYHSFFAKKKNCFVEKRNEHPNLLFRPIGQTLLAKVYRHFKATNELDYLKANINKIDFSLPGIHFDRVTWNNGRMETKYQRVAFMLLLYLLDRLSTTETEGERGLIEQFKLATKGSIDLPEKVV